MIKLIGLFTYLLLGVATNAYASFGDEAASVGMAARLMCETFTVMSGTLGLLAGFALALYGLWLIIMSGEMKGGMLFIVVGAILTAIPGITRTILIGTSEFFQAAKISSDTITYAVDYAYSNRGQCNQIPVDFSYYDDQSAAYNQSRGTGPDGKPLPSPRQAGMPAMGSGDARGRATVGGVSEADKRGGANPPGCAERVEGGTLGNRGYGMQMHPIKKYMKMHTGTDIRCARGAKINHTGGGTIILAKSWGGYGNRVEVSVPGGIVKTYSHLVGFAPGVTVGASAPTVIGYCGSTGLSTGNHLHFEVMKNGNFVNPPTNGC